MKPDDVTADAVATWPAAKINAALDRLEARSSKNTAAFIDAGRGYERPSDYMYKDDPLSREAIAISDAQGTLRNEIFRRYGPSAPHRLPRGFGPIGAHRKSRARARF